MADSSAVAPPVTIRTVAPTFLVADVAGTALWYAAHLGFQLAGCVPKEEPHVYASLMRGPAEIMLLALEGYRKPDPGGRRPGGVWDAYIRMDGVATLYESLKGQPFVETPLKHQPYGDWEFEVRDPNGYVLVFGGGY